MNNSLHSAKRIKNDEFYTRYCDIEDEMSAYINYNPDVFRDKTVLLPCDDEYSNFTRYFINNFKSLGIKKLISTSYAFNISNRKLAFSGEKIMSCTNKEYNQGKLFILKSNETVDINNLEFTHLDGDGDFRSKEVTNFRNEADIIITNPPFSLFREFLDWIIKANKQFIILGNINAIGYKQVFPLLKNNEMWLGYKTLNSDMYFHTPELYRQWLVANKKEGSAYKIVNKEVMVRLGSGCWFTNLAHGKRYKTLNLDTKKNNLLNNKRLKKKLNDYNVGDYPKYDNYDAIEVPFTECIPSDYDGVMGVPITFMDKYNPEQFEIVKFRKGDDGKDLRILGKDLYSRILIKNKRGN